MSLVREPFEIKWGSNVITDIEEVNIEHSIESTDFTTVQGQTLELDGAYKVTATITLLASDIPALAAILPQYFVANNGTLSTGETVNSATGAIDIKAATCSSSTTYNDLDIKACGNPGQVLRIVNARTKIEGIEVDNVIQKVMIKFIGESDSDEATVQIFTYGTLVS